MRGRAVYIHAHIYTELRTYTAGHWRVFEGLLLLGGDSLSLPADVLFIDGQGLIHVERETHLSHQCGAATWVYANEFELLAKKIEDDWSHRHLWRQAYEDVQKLRAERGISDEEAGRKADQIVTLLFTNAAGQEAKRLVLELEDGRDGGGWGKEPVRDLIIDTLKGKGE